MSGQDEKTFEKVSSQNALKKWEQNEFTADKIDVLYMQMAQQRVIRREAKKKMKELEHEINKLRLRAEIGDVVRCEECNERTVVSECFLAWGNRCEQHWAD